MRDRPAGEPVSELAGKRAEKEVERLRRFLTRIADGTEISGLGDVDPAWTGPAANELRVRMAMAQRGLDGEEYP